MQYLLFQILWDRTDYGRDLFRKRPLRENGGGVGVIWGNLYKSIGQIFLHGQTQKEKISAMTYEPWD